MLTRAEAYRQWGSRWLWQAFLYLVKRGKYQLLIFQDSRERSRVLLYNATVWDKMVF